jgi:hypothetical protein
MRLVRSGHGDPKTCPELVSGVAPELFCGDATYSQPCGSVVPRTVVIPPIDGFGVVWRDKFSLATSNLVGRPAPFAPW